MFEWDVLALYGPVQNKIMGSPSKPQLMHVDLVDRDDQLTITVNTNDNLVYHFMKYFTCGNNVWNSSFVTRNKGPYDRVDTAGFQQNSIEIIL